MSETNALRYEIISEKKGLHSALKRQQERIQGMIAQLNNYKNDELMAARERQAKIEFRVNQTSDWMESLDRMASVQKAKKDFNQKRAEVKLLQNASVMVRRAQLQKLLEEEYKMYELELNSLGKTFYIKRS